MSVKEEFDLSLMLPGAIYKNINNLMKTMLDYGTLVTDDPAKLRSYKELVKTSFRQKWVEIAEMLELADLVERCGCDESKFCERCKGSRFVSNTFIVPDEEVAIAFSNDIDEESLMKLKKAYTRMEHHIYGKKPEFIHTQPPA